MQPDKKNERDNKDRKDHEQHQPKTARPPRELDDRQQQKPGPRENEPRRSRS